MSRLHAVAAALGIVIWGTQFVVANAAMEHMSPYLLVALRFLPLAIIALAVVPKPKVSWWVIIGYGTLMGSLEFGLLFLSMRVGLSSGLASLVIQSSAPLTVILSALLFRVRPTMRVAVGLLLCVAALVVIGAGRGGSAPVAGVVICVLSGLAWAFGNILAGRVRCREPFALALWMAVAVPIPMLVLALIVDGPQATWAGVSSLWGPDAVTVVLAVLYLGLMSSAVATGIWTFLITQYGADRIAPLSTAVPVIGVAMGALVLHEPLGAEVLIAGAVMVVGLFLVTYQRRKPPNLLDTREPAT